jgi:hypothetical protein
VLEFEFTGTVFRWQGTAAWHFIALPEPMGRDIDAFCSELKAGWGSIRVQVRIGTTSWSTSIFPDSTRDTYLLPVKAAVRRAEGIADGDEVDVVLTT